MAWFTHSGQSVYHAKLGLPHVYIQAWHQSFAEHSQLFLVLSGSIRIRLNVTNSVYVCLPVTHYTVTGHM